MKLRNNNLKLLTVLILLFSRSVFAIELHELARNGTAEELWKAAVAEPLKMMDSLEKVDQDGMTPLQIATNRAQSDVLNIIKTLLIQKYYTNHRGTRQVDQELVEKMRGFREKSEHQVSEENLDIRSAKFVDDLVKFINSAKARQEDLTAPVGSCESKPPCAHDELRNQDTEKCHKVAVDFIKSDGVFKTINGWVAAITGNQVIGALYCTRAGLINEVEVDSSFRGQGLGKKLMELTLKSCAKPGETLTLDVASDNIPAIKLYHSVGFKIVKDKPTDSILHMEYHRPKL